MAAQRKRVGEDFVHPLPEYSTLPPLPPVRTVSSAKYVGPTEESNWLIYGHLLVGAYPSSVHDSTNTQILSGILRLGITTFVCLQQEYQHEGVTEAEWRGGYKLRPYIFDAIKLVDTLPPAFFPGGVKPDGLEFVHFPIVDCAIANDASVLQLSHDLVGRIVKGERIYLHCWGGHGRTGTVASIMLGLLYGLSPLDCMRWVQFCHDLRIAPIHTRSPQTEVQRQQVIRVLNAVRAAQGAPARGPRPALLSPQPASVARGVGSASGGSGGGAAATAAGPLTPPYSRQPASTGAATVQTTAAQRQQQVQQLQRRPVAVAVPAAAASASAATSAAVSAGLSKGRYATTSPHRAAPPPPIQIGATARDSGSSSAADVTASPDTSSAVASASAAAAVTAPGTPSTPTRPSWSAIVATSNATGATPPGTPKPGTPAASARAAAAATAAAEGSVEAVRSAPGLLVKEAQPIRHDAAHTGLHAQSYMMPLASQGIGVATGGAGGSSHSTAAAAAATAAASAAAAAASAAVLSSPGGRLLHASPRPAALLSLTQEPTIDAVLRDREATSIDPLVSTTASLLGLKPGAAATSSSGKASSTASSLAATAGGGRPGAGAAASGGRSLAATVPSSRGGDMQMQVQMRTPQRPVTAVVDVDAGTITTAGGGAATPEPPLPTYEISVASILNAALKHSSGGSGNGAAAASAARPATAAAAASPSSARTPSRPSTAASGSGGSGLFSSPVAAASASRPGTSAGISYASAAASGAAAAASAATATASSSPRATSTIGQRLLRTNKPDHHTATSAAYANVRSSGYGHNSRAGGSGGSGGSGPASPAPRSSASASASASSEGPTTPGPLAPGTTVSHDMLFKSQAPKLAESSADVPGLPARLLTPSGSSSSSSSVPANTSSSAHGTPAPASRAAPSARASTSSASASATTSVSASSATATATAAATSAAVAAATAAANAAREVARRPAGPSSPASPATAPSPQQPSAQQPQPSLRPSLAVPATGAGGLPSPSTQPPDALTPRSSAKVPVMTQLMAALLPGEAGSTAAAAAAAASSDGRYSPGNRPPTPPRPASIATAGGQ